jgi:hypothetical protein
MVVVYNIILFRALISLIFAIPLLFLIHSRMLSLVQTKSLSPYQLVNRVYHPNDQQMFGAQYRLFAKLPASLCIAETRKNGY